MHTLTVRLSAQADQRHTSNGRIARTKSIASKPPYSMRRMHTRDSEYKLVLSFIYPLRCLSICLLQHVFVCLSILFYL